MKSSYLCTKYADFGPFSVKEWLCVLILLIPGTLCNGNISLAIINFSPSEVELACHGSYDGNMTSIFFDVYRGPLSCLHRSSNRCRETLDCSIFCLASADLSTLPFWVKLDERCDETMVVRCLIHSSTSGTMLDLEESVKLTAHSYPPEISVNGGQPVEASSDQVQIVCTVRNKCNKTKLEINVEANMQQVSTTHTLEGSRFTTTTVSTAIFYDPGNYTITCKEMGKDVEYSRNYILLVGLGGKGTPQMEEEISQHHIEPFIGLAEPLVYTVLIIIMTSIAVFAGWKLWKKIRKESPHGESQEEETLLTEREESSHGELQEEETLLGEREESPHGDLQEEETLLGEREEREREMEERLKRLMNLNMSKTTEESEIKQLILELEHLKTLKSEGYGDCIAKLIETDQFEKFTKEHQRIRKARNLEISKGILAVLIDECNAQKIYNIFKNQIRSSSEMNYSALFDVLTMCLEKGACPATDEIYEISLLNLDVCTTYQAALATVKMIEALIGAYRKQGNTEPIDLHLNSIQGQWKVSEDLRIAAGAVIREAYGTLNNCLKSESVINTLLFISKGDHVRDTKKVFKVADAIQQGADTETLFPKFNKWHAIGFNHKKPYPIEQQTRKLLMKRNDNWLKRNVLHLAAIFCHDAQVWKCIPDKMKRLIDQQDLHGCTPLHLAYLHENQDAIMFLEKNGAAQTVNDYFGNIPKGLTPDSTVPSTKYMIYTRKIMTANSSVFDKMKDMLVEPCSLIEKNLEELFQRITKDDPLITETVIRGSVIMKLKAGRYDKYVVQIIVTSKLYHKEKCACLRKHEELVKKMGEIDKKGISLRCVAVGNPWRFIWEGDDNCKGLEISVDVVVILEEGRELNKQRRQGLIIDNAPGYNRHISSKEPSWQDTLWMHEYDIFTNLSPGCRLAILITKALLESLDQTRGSIYFWKKQITTYIVQNTLLWILAGETPKQISMEYGNIIGKRYGALRQQLLYKEIDAKWMTREDLEKYEEDGRFWAEKILDAIQFVAEKCSKKLGNFLKNCCHDLDTHEMMDVLDTCKICLERLRPEVFFSEKHNISEMVGGESNLRTRLQQVIDRLNVEAEKVPGALLWKKKKEMKELKIRIAYCGMIKKAELERKCKELHDEVDRLSLKYNNQEEQSLLLKQEERREELEKAIQQSIELMGRVNENESLLFRLRGEYEMEMDSENNNPSKRQREKRKNLEKDNKQCEELKKENEELRICSNKHLQWLEENLKLLFNDQTEMQD